MFEPHVKLLWCSVAKHLEREQFSFRSSAFCSFRGSLMFTSLYTFRKQQESSSLVG